MAITQSLFFEHLEENTSGRSIFHSVGFRRGLMGLFGVLGASWVCSL